MMLAIWEGLSASPRPAGMSDTFLTVEMLARLRSTVRSRPPGSRSVTLVGESETAMPTMVSPRWVLAITVSKPGRRDSLGNKTSRRMTSGAPPGASASTYAPRASPDAGA